MQYIYLIKLFNHQLNWGMCHLTLFLFWINLVICWFLLFYQNRLVTCIPCQLDKSHRLPFDNNNNKRALHVLDLVHFVLWGPSPVNLDDSYCYYVIFVDDFSWFTWLYLFNSKSGFHVIFSVFIKFVHNQFSSNIKVFQSDRGTEILNCYVLTLLN